MAAVSFEPPEAFSIADYFLDDRVREGRGDRTALVCGERRLSYREVQSLANRFANAFAALGLEPEQRVLIALPDSPEYVGALFGAFKTGAVAVMANPALNGDEIGYFLDYTRSRLAVVHAERLETWGAAAAGSRWLKRLLVVGGEPGGHASWEAEASGRVRPLPRTSPRTAMTPAFGSSPAAPRAGPRRSSRPTAPTPTPPSSTPRPPSATPKRT